MGLLGCGVHVTATSQQDRNGLLPAWGQNAVPKLLGTHNTTGHDSPQKQERHLRRQEEGTGNGTACLPSRPGVLISRLHWCTVRCDNLLISECLPTDGTVGLRCEVTRGTALPVARRRSPCSSSQRMLSKRPSESARAVCRGHGPQSKNLLEGTGHIGGEQAARRIAGLRCEGVA